MSDDELEDHSAWQVPKKKFSRLKRATATSPAQLEATPDTVRKSGSSDIKPSKHSCSQGEAVEHLEKSPDSFRSGQKTAHSGPENSSGSTLHQESCEVGRKVEASTSGQKHSSQGADSDQERSYWDEEDDLQALQLKQKNDSLKGKTEGPEGEASDNVCENEQDSCGGYSDSEGQQTDAEGHTDSDDEEGDDIGPGDDSCGDAPKGTKSRPARGGAHGIGCGPKPQIVPMGGVLAKLKEKHTAFVNRALQQKRVSLPGFSPTRPAPRPRPSEGSSELEIASDEEDVKEEATSAMPAMPLDFAIGSETQDAFPVFKAQVPQGSEHDPLQPQDSQLDALLPRKTPPKSTFAEMGRRLRDEKETSAEKFTSAEKKQQNANDKRESIELQAEAVQHQVNAARDAEAPNDHHKSDPRCLDMGEAVIPSSLPKDPAANLQLEAAEAGKQSQRQEDDQNGVTARHACNAAAAEQESVPEGLQTEGNRLVAPVHPRTEEPDGDQNVTTNVQQGDLVMQCATSFVRQQDVTHKDLKQENVAGDIGKQSKEETADLVSEEEGSYHDSASSSEDESDDEEEEVEEVSPGAREKAMAEARAVLKDRPMGKKRRREYMEDEAEMSEDEGHSDDDSRDSEENAEHDEVLEDLIGYEKEGKRDAKRRAEAHAAWLLKQDERDLQRLLDGVQNGFKKRKAPELLGLEDGSLADARRRRAAIDAGDESGDESEGDSASSSSSSESSEEDNAEGTQQIDSKVLEDVSDGEGKEGLQRYQQQKLLRESQDKEAVAMDLIDAESQGLLDSLSARHIPPTELLVEKKTRAKTAFSFSPQEVRKSSATASFLGRSNVTTVGPTFRPNAQQKGRSYIFGREDSNSKGFDPADEDKENAEKRPIGPTSFAGIKRDGLSLNTSSRNSLSGLLDKIGPDDKVEMLLGSEPRKASSAVRTFDLKEVLGKKPKLSKQSFLGRK